MNIEYKAHIGRLILVMSLTVKDIYALRGTNRNVKIPQEIITSIGLVQKSIEKNGGSGGGGTMTGKPNEWRNSKPRNAPSSGFTNAKPNKKSFESAQTEQKPVQKYVSKFKKATEDIDGAILNTILRGKLNKFSQSNYEEIKEFITHIIDGGQTEMIKAFMKLVFEKAASEEIFCPLYAKLISELSQAYPILLTEMANLYTQYMQIFEHVADGQSEDYDGLCQRNIEKKYRRGYSQFLAELIKNNVMDTDMFMQMIITIIEQVEKQTANKDSVKLIEEYADCLMKITKAISTSDHQSVRDLRAVLKRDTITRITPLTVRNPEFVGLSSKTRFTFLDIHDAIQKF